MVYDKKASFCVFFSILLHTKNVVELPLQRF